MNLLEGLLEGLLTEAKKGKKNLSNKKFKTEKDVFKFMKLNRIALMSTKVDYRYDENIIIYNGNEGRADVLSTAVFYFDLREKDSSYSQAWCNTNVKGKDVDWETNNDMSKYNNKVVMKAGTELGHDELNASDWDNLNKFYDWKIEGNLGSSE